MLAALVGVQVAAGVLTGGAWDAWALAPAAAALCLIGGAAAALRAAGGFMPLPSRGVAAWVAALASAAAVSAATSPVSAYAWPAWAGLAAGLWLIAAVTMIDADARESLEQGVRAAAWALVFLAVYQRIHGSPRPASAFPNENVFAGAILLILPFAARRGDFLLAAALIIELWWTRSVGAWLGLAAALVLGRRSVGAVAARAGAAIGAAGLIAAYAKLESARAFHRLAWWAAAWRMGAASAWLGLGPGAFAYALPAYAPAGVPLWTRFAHQYFLQTFAECGIAYLAVWTAGLAVILWRSRSPHRFGLIAALVHGLVDYPLNLPGVFWLFCLSAGLALPESGETLALRGGARWKAAAAVAALSTAAAWMSVRGWRAARLREQAVAAIESGISAAVPASELEASERLRPDPETARLAAELALSRAARGEQPAVELPLAAAQFETAASLDPYRASNWTLLSAVYAKLGRKREAESALNRGAASCPSLRTAR